MDLYASTELIKKFKTFLKRHINNLGSEKLRYYNEKFNKWKWSRDRWNQVAQMWASIDLVRQPPEQLIDLEIIPDSRAWPSDSIMLCVGSGPALIEIFIAKEVLSQYRIICLDYAEQMCFEGLKVARTEGVNNINFCVGNVLAMPFQTGSIDYIEAMGILEHLSDSEINIALQEFNRVLRLPRELQERQIYVATREWVKNQISDKVKFVHP